jgi:hypothetical protein
MEIKPIGNPDLVSSSQLLVRYQIASRPALVPRTLSEQWAHRAFDRFSYAAGMWIDGYQRKA